MTTQKGDVEDVTSTLGDTVKVVGHDEDRGEIQGNGLECRKVTDGQEEMQYKAHGTTVNGIDDVHDPDKKQEPFSDLFVSPISDDTQESAQTSNFLPRHTFEANGYIDSKPTTHRTSFFLVQSPGASSSRSQVDVDITTTPEPHSEPITPTTAPGDDPQSNDIPDDEPSELRLTPARVRFRSRVRIASGFRKTYSGDTSPASSVSAPLRYHTDDSEAEHTHPRQHTGPDNANAPLSQLLSMDATNAWLQKMHLMKSARRDKRMKERQEQDERTALLAEDRARQETQEGPPSMQYASTTIANVDAPPYEPSTEDIDKGQWKSKYFDRHWWWRKIEPVACYCCNDTDSDESDED